MTVFTWCQRCHGVYNLSATGITTTTFYFRHHSKRTQRDIRPFFHLFTVPSVSIYNVVTPLYVLREWMPRVTSPSSPNEGNEYMSPPTPNSRLSPSKKTMALDSP